MSDHSSGTRALADPAIDLTDLYAFPGSSGADQLVLAMNVFPNARPPALFSDAASYRFRVRPATIPAGHPGSRFDVGTDEYAFTCTFSAPVEPDANGELTQRGTCVLPDQEAVSFQVNDELIARHPEAYADHAAEFWLSVGGIPRRALGLARQNLTFRPTPRAHALANRAMRQSLVAPIELALGTTAVDA